MIAEEEKIINKVANSGLVTLDLEDYYTPGQRVMYDLKQNLYMGLILKEKDFRNFLKAHDWPQYSGKYVGIHCSEDVVIPTWAYMLLASKLQPFAKKIIFGDIQKLEEYLFEKAIENIDIENYRNQRVVIKGCSKIKVPTQTYISITNKLLPVVQSIMFGEPCSTVPVYKRKVD